MLFVFRYLIWSGPNADGGTSFYYYNDVITWIAGALALAALVWFLTRCYLRASRRPRRRIDRRQLKRVAKIKNDLSRRLLPLGVSNNIHAVGVGMLSGSDQYCIQIFVRDATQELWDGSGASGLPNNYRGVPLELVEMVEAVFASDAVCPTGIREHQEVIIGGISGANTNLTGQSGTIGYFCRRKSRIRRANEVLMISCSHVFADLQNSAVDDSDLIMQPSPGEAANNRPIGSLVNFYPLKFESDTADPDQIDAAIAKLWPPHQHQLLLPFIGAVKGHVPKRDINVGDRACKFGRTTGLTKGRVSTIKLDIRIRYDRTHQSAFFRDQILIEPDTSVFVRKGDSGSLLVNENQEALGLIFGGMSEAPQPQHAPASATTVRKISGYGVATPISDVMQRMKVELIV